MYFSQLRRIQTLICESLPSITSPNNYKFKCIPLINSFLTPVGGGISCYYLNLIQLNLADVNYGDWRKRTQAFFKNTNFQLRRLIFLMG